MKPYRIRDSVFMVGGPDLSDPRDCCIYLIDAKGKLALIDAGVGRGSAEMVLENMRALGFDPSTLEYVIATHAHIDHIGGLRRLREAGAKVVAHELDALAIEKGAERIGAFFYGVDYEPCKVDLRVTEDGHRLSVGEKELLCLHIPGHTPGSMAVVLEIEEGKILFGQDIHGPYLEEIGSDPEAAKKSLKKLIDLEADILCEGHYGVIRPAEEVRKFIEGPLKSLTTP